jgi:hypothetical protein
VRNWLHRRGLRRIVYFGLNLVYCLVTGRFHLCNQCKHPVQLRLNSIIWRLLVQLNTFPENDHKILKLKLNPIHCLLQPVHISDLGLIAQQTFKLINPKFLVNLTLERLD